MSPIEGVVLFIASAVASGINSVAGGGSLISYPILTVGFGLEGRIANATNSVGLFPGSLAGGLGFGKTHLERTGVYFRKLLIPTTLGSILGAFLLLNTSAVAFKIIIPFLILLASTLLWFQPKVKQMLARKEHSTVSPSLGLVLQFLVATYGGYFGAGMGIMMLASFALYMEGSTHELNAVKSWLGTIINFTCSIVFVIKGLVHFDIAWVLVIGSIVGGFAAARMSLKVDPDKLRVWIAIYGFIMTIYFFMKIFS
jgi:uncharacterized membrane protein YfcA